MFPQGCVSNGRDEAHSAWLKRCQSGSHSPCHNSVYTNQLQVASNFQRQCPCGTRLLGAVGLLGAEVPQRLRPQLHVAAGRRVAQPHARLDQRRVVARRHVQLRDGTELLRMTDRTAS